MIYTFCTLFDKNYVYRGLALHDSLVRTTTDFELYILCLDQETFDVLTQLQLPHTRLLSLGDVEDQAVLRAKANRTRVEYYWTLASVLTAYILQHQSDVEHLAYVDSDVFFFSSPEPLYKELGDGAVLIIRHNYSPELRYLEKRSGVYNVGLVWFRNNAEGLACLTRWRDDCLTWCYNRLEAGKFGDQMYLDSWPNTYPGVRVLKTLGGGVAPWNVAQYAVRMLNGILEVAPGQPLIFFHFHTLRILGLGQYIPHSAAYRFKPEVYNYIYGLHFQSLDKVINRVQHHQLKSIGGFNSPEGLYIRMRDTLKRYAVQLYFKIFTP